MLVYYERYMNVYMFVYYAWTKSQYACDINIIPQPCS